MSDFREKSRLLYVTLRPYQYTNILIFYLLLHHTIFNLSRDQTVTDHMIKVDFTNITSNLHLEHLGASTYINSTNLRDLMLKYSIFQFE